MTLVPVAAILVASIRLHWPRCRPLSLRNDGANVFPCDASFGKGDEMGWFEHGSTIIVFAPRGILAVRRIQEGARIRMGEPLMRLP